MEDVEYYCDKCGVRTSFGMNVCEQHREYPSSWSFRGAWGGFLHYQRHIAPFHIEEKTKPVPAY